MYGDCSVTPVNEPVTQLAVKTTLENGLSSQVVTVYTGNGLPAEVDEYDFGVSTPTRKTITAYASLGNNISDRPDSVTVYDAAGNVASKTTYKYDEAVPQPMTLPGHVTVSGSRGNPTTVTEWINNSGTATRVTHYAYDDAGQITSITDPLGNATSYNYDAATDAYRTRVTRPTTAGVAHTSTFAYGPNSGFLVSSVDENGQSATYIYDSMFRPSSVSYPGGGQTTYTYTPTSRTTNVLLSPGILLPTVEQNDGYGRKLRVTKPDGSMTDFTYDSLARLSTQGNPHFASSSPTDGVTTYQYDALDRVTQVAQPDGTVPTPGSTCLANNICNSYSGNTATVSDQAGNPRRSVTDALGRLIQVDEPGSSFAGSVSLGTLTIGGTLRSQAGVGATPGTGTITIGGAWFSIDMLRW